MFWTLDEPGKATIALFTTFVFIAICVIPIFAFPFKCRWWKLALFSLLMGMLMLPPSCRALWKEIDKARFGRFDYHRFEDVKDQRIERYLPPKATRISLNKDQGGNGYIARYSISEEELVAYLDRLWDRYGQNSVMSREELHRLSNGITSDPRYDLMIDTLADTDELPETSKPFFSPHAGNGAGAKYYYVEETGDVFQSAAYW